MAKPHCEKHKRYVPYCDDCKAVVKAAEEAELQAERDALAESPEAEEEDARAKQAVLDDALREEESNALQEGIGFPGASKKEVPPVSPPEESVDWDKEIDQVEETFREGAESEAASETPPAVEIDGGGNVVPVQNLDSPVEDVKDLIDATEAALAEAPDTAGNDPFPKATAAWKAYEEKMRQEGRKEVIAMVREWFSDSIDTGAFQLLAHLEKRCR